MKVQRFGDAFSGRRKANARAMAALGVDADAALRGSRLRTIRNGNGVIVLTVGYEKRSGDELMSVLVDAGVTTLIDVREKPVSRVRAFSSAALSAACENVGLGYESWKELGSTSKLREELKETGDIRTFHRKFRTLAKRSKTGPMKRLAKLAQEQTVALLCYERRHEDCHRSDIAHLIAEEIDATVKAID